MGLEPKSGWHSVLSVVILLAALSQALGLLETSMGAYDGDDCSLQA